MNWADQRKLQSKSYTCGHCGSSISSEKGFFAVLEGNPLHEENAIGWIYICHKCLKPTFFNIDDTQTPGVLYGRKFNVAIPEEINNLYEEAKKCYSVNAFTSTGLCCRKLLMHIAVELGAKEGLKFIEYVNYLDTESYIPRNSKKWVDIIRTKGNEANHEIKILSQKDAEQLIMFSSIIINLIYENELLLDNGEADET